MLVVVHDQGGAMCWVHQAVGRKVIDTEPGFPLERNVHVRLLVTVNITRQNRRVAEHEFHQRTGLAIELGHVRHQAKEAEMVSASVRGIGIDARQIQLVDMRLEIGNTVHGKWRTNADKDILCQAGITLGEHEGVGSSPAGQLVERGTADQPIIAGATVERVRARETGQTSFPPRPISRSFPDPPPRMLSVEVPMIGF